MSTISLNLPEDEARLLYRHLHQAAGAQDQFCETYRQLQGHFFRRMTVDEVTTLLEEEQ